MINQTYKEIEVLLIVSLSTDNSYEICKDFSSKDERIKIYQDNINGPSSARNIGIKNSTSEFIFFLDSDDFLNKNSLELLMNTYNIFKSDLTIGDFKKINGNRNDTVFLSDRILYKQDIFDYLMNYLKNPNKYLMLASIWGKLYKSSIIKNNNILFNTNLSKFEDSEFNYKYINYVDNMFFIKEQIYNYNSYDNFLSGSTNIGNDPNKMFGFIQSLHLLKEFLEKNYVNNDEIDKRIGHATISLTIIYLVITCSQINTYNIFEIYKTIKNIINNVTITDNLKLYSPTKDNSKLIPFLIKHKLCCSIMIVCKYKGFIRYGKL